MKSQHEVKYLELLPVGTYNVVPVPPFRGGGYYFEIVHDFQMPHELYGTKIQGYAHRILTTFLDRPSSSSTGVLLSGGKGSGKTLLTKLVSTKAAKMEIPTLIVE